MFAQGEYRGNFLKPILIFFSIYFSEKFIHNKAKILLEPGIETILEASWGFFCQGVTLP
jgi:hypothetical protein